MATLKEENATKQAKAERDTARRLYLVSLWTPFLILGLPCLGPIFLILFLSSLTSSHPFARWHTVQWTLLTVAAVSLGVVGWDSGGFLILTTISGWYLGNFIGWQQVNRGDCWLWKLWNDAAELPRPWALAPDAAPAAEAAMPSTASADKLPVPVPVAPTPTAPAEPHAAFAQGRALVLQGQQDEAVAYFLAAFRDGPPNLRRRAVAELEKLGEVEVF